MRAEPFRIASVTDAPARVLRARWVDNEMLMEDVIFAALIAAKTVKGFSDRSRAAYDCWRYLRTCVEYIPEDDPFGQVVRLPWVTVQEGRADCKSQAVFIAGLCAASGCQAAIRFIQEPTRSYLNHVYAIINGRAVDPLLAYGQEASYIRQITIPIHG